MEILTCALLGILIGGTQAQTRNEVAQSLRDCATAIGCSPMTAGKYKP